MAAFPRIRKDILRKLCGEYGGYSPQRIHPPGPAVPVNTWPEAVSAASKLSEFTFGFAVAIFRRYVGDELTMTLVAKVENAPDIDDLRFPFLVETPGLRNG